VNATRNGQGGANIFNNQADAQANKARGDFDRPHRFVVSYSYDVPMPKSDFFQHQVFRGWAISGIVTYQSGLHSPFTDYWRWRLSVEAPAPAFSTARPDAAYTTGGTDAKLAHY